ncbi:MAG: hypothetical protein EAZ53_15645 [Bacteroidetes bacterium]|nr:MAG: hypothetical protein EAZ53_15645 [Bacteroidota bacterium]
MRKLVTLVQEQIISMRKLVALVQEQIICMRKLVVLVFGQIVIASEAKQSHTTRDCIGRSSLAMTITKGINCFKTQTGFETLSALTTMQSHNTRDCFGRSSLAMTISKCINR